MGAAVAPPGVAAAVESAGHPIVGSDANSDRSFGPLSGASRCRAPRKEERGFPSRFPFLTMGARLGNSVDNEVIALFSRHIWSWNMEGAAPQSLKTGEAGRIYTQGCDAAMYAE